MKRLGIAIKNTIQGSGEPFKINPGTWTGKVTDLRTVLRHVPSLQTDPKRTATLFFFSEEGAYIIVGRSYQNRPDDNVTGWIFVPNDIEISGEDLLKAVEAVRQIIFLPELPVRSAMEQQFAKEYPLKSGSVHYTPSPKNGRFAKRDVTPGMPLQVILGSGLYQQYYRDFEAIFIEQFPGEVVDATDLTNRPLENLITLQPPTKEALERAGGKGTLLFFAANNEQFRAPVRVGKGAKLELKAMKAGMMPQTVYITADERPIELTKIYWQKELTPKDFIIYGPMGDRLTNNLSVTVNGMQINNQPKYISESDMRNARVVVKHKNGDSTTETIDFTRTPVTIYLKGSGSGNSNTESGMSWNLHLADDSRGKITVTGGRLKRYESPLRGYEAEGDWLRYKGGNIWLQRAIGFCSALVIGGITVGILAMCGVFSHKGKDIPSNDGAPESQVEQQGPTTNNPSGNMLEAEAIAYLDGNKVNEKLVWRRSEMETYPILRGLYDALNEFDFNKVIHEYAPQLTGSNEFNTLMSHIEKNHKNGWETYAKKKTTGGTYNDTGDEMIDINNYKLWIDSNCTKATDSSVAPKSAAQGPTQAPPQAKPAIPKQNKPETSTPKDENKGGTTSTNKPQQKPQPNKNGSGNTTSQSMEGL